MNKFIELVKVNIIMALAQMNLIRVSSSKKQDRGYLWVIGAVYAGLMVYFGWMMKMLYGKLEPFHLQWIILLLLFSVLTLMTLMIGLFTVGGVLFESRDLDQLFSYPLSSNQILFSKITALIVENWPLDLVFALPVLGVYSYYTHPSTMFYLCAVLGFLFIPLLPLTVAVIISYLVNLISMGKRARNTINIVLILACVGSINFLIRAVVNNLPSIIAGSSSLTEGIQKFYPPVGYLVNAINNNSLSDLLIFLAINVIPFVVLTTILSRWYKSLRTKTTATKKVKSKGLTYKVSSPFSNLLRKEFGRYFSSAYYVLNSSIGLILITFFTVSSSFSGKQIRVILNLFADNKTAGMVVLFCFLAALANTTAPSISLEGKNLWILKASPVDVGTILLAKLCVQLTIAIPVLIIDSVILSLTLHFSFMSFLWVCLIPVLVSVLSGLVGLIANLRYHRFDFTNEMQVVKNSASVLISMFGMWLVIGAFAGIYLLFQNVVSFDVFATVVVGVLLVLTLITGRYLFTKGKKQFELL